MILFLTSMLLSKPDLMRNPDQGAVTPINCAVNPQLNSQQHFYFDNCTVKQPSNLSM